MLNRVIIILVVLCFTASVSFGMNVPSQGAETPQPPKPHAGGKQMTTQEIVLISVGAVCATILLLALID